MEHFKEHYYSAECEDIKRVYGLLDKLKKGEFVNLSTSKMWREDKQRLIDICTNYIIFHRHEGNDGYWFNMDKSIFFYE